MSTGGIARDISIFEGSMAPGSQTGTHAHSGDEHHVILSGRVRIAQGDSVVDAGRDSTFCSTARSRMTPR